MPIPSPFPFLSLFEPRNPSNKYFVFCYSYYCLGWGQGNKDKAKQPNITRGKSGLCFNHYGSHLLSFNHSVIFLLFALGLEFSTTKVGLYTNLFIPFSLNLYIFSSAIYNVYLSFMLAASSCSSSGYSWRPTPNFLIYVLVWNNSFSMPFTSTNSLQKFNSYTLLVCSHIIQNILLSVIPQTHDTHNVYSLVHFWKDFLIYVWSMMN